MKKVLLLCIATLVMTTLLAGCGGTPNAENQEGANPMEKVENAAESILPNNVNTSEFIGEDKAKAIALEKAGVKAEEVKFDRVELDKDDGVWQYEIEFYKGRTEYEADIDAKTGEIRSFDADIDD